MSRLPPPPRPDHYRPVRRIVTGHDDAGQSVILSDAVVANITLHTHGPLVAHVPWATDESPARCDVADPAPQGRAFRASPGPQGTILRIVDFPPDSAYEGQRTEALIDEISPDEHSASARHFMFHRTHTLDYALVLEGEIWALLDIGEALMKPGDVLIQRATNHSWSNRSQSVCRMAFVLIDAVDARPAGVPAAPLPTEGR